MESLLFIELSDKNRGQNGTSKMMLTRIEHKVENELDPALDSGDPYDADAVALFNNQKAFHV